MFYRVNQLCLVKTQKMSQKEWTFGKFRRYLCYMNTEIDESVAKFGERVKELRTQKKLSQAALGEKIGVQPTHIGRYERGESMPTAKALWLLAQALEVSIDYLVKGDLEQAVTTTFQDTEFMRMFKEAQSLPESEKLAVKTVVDAVLMRNRLKDQLAASK